MCEERKVERKGRAKGLGEGLLTAGERTGTLLAVLVALTGVPGEEDLEDSSEMAVEGVVGASGGGVHTKWVWDATDEDHVVDHYGSYHQLQEGRKSRWNHS